MSLKMNCCLILLFLLFCNNGSCGCAGNNSNDCGCGGILGGNDCDCGCSNNDRDRDCGCNNVASDRDRNCDRDRDRDRDCGCGNMNIPPSWARTNFNDTCGCEEK